MARRDFLLGAAALGATGLFPAPASARPGRAKRQRKGKRKVLFCPLDPRDGRDVTAELAAWLQQLPPHSIADLRGRTYRSETAIKLVDKADLTIRNGVLVRTVVGAVVYPTPNPHLWLLRPSRCTVENLTIIGTNTVSDGKLGFGSYQVAFEFEAAVRMEKFTDCRVTGLEVDAVWGDGVQWHGGSGAYMADCVIDRNGRQGVTTNGSNVLIERVRIEHSRRSGFDIEPVSAKQAVGNIEIRHSFIHSRLLPFAAGGAGSVNGVFLHHNTSDGASVPVLYVGASDGARRANWRFEDHVSLSGLGSPVQAVRLANVDGFSVARNRMPVSHSRSLLTVGATGCGGQCRVVENDFAGGRLYFNRTPRPDQTIEVTGNSPTLTEVA